MLISMAHSKASERAKEAGAAVGSFLKLIPNAYTFVINSGFIYISLPFLNFSQYMINWLITDQITKKIQEIIRTCIRNEQSSW